MNILLSYYDTRRLTITSASETLQQKFLLVLDAISEPRPCSMDYTDTHQQIASYHLLHSPPHPLKTETTKYLSSFARNQP